MNTLSFIYWSRVALGIGAAVLCTLLNILAQGSLTIFSNLSVALLVYLITYYVYKWKFFAYVNKPSKIFTHGIGAFFLSWIVALATFFTFINPIADFAYSPELPVRGTTVTFNAANSYSPTGHIISYTWYFGDGENITVTSPIATHIYTEPGNYTVNLIVTNTYGLSAMASKIVEVVAS